MAIRAGSRDGGLDQLPSQTVASRLRPDVEAFHFTPRAAEGREEHDPGNIGRGVLCQQERAGQVLQPLRAAIANSPRIGEQEVLEKQFLG
ncbi:MAG: hypothetical protein QOH66_1490 [Actinomycetota bacterium]|nr:hypothetical protein [Actinomycetota bacterium]